MIKRSFDRLEMWVISGVVITLVITLAVVFYSINVVSGDLYDAFSPAQSPTPAISFNINGYNSLGL
ncbi:MAG: hypothetical protein M1361_00225 [Patescibacteria group bacterium]|nr:hypothetical protein [Patescibacteria group bacterium]MCL5224044.1 hypothetical protein [Patescibacteria group bacterium]